MLFQTQILIMSTKIQLSSNIEISHGGSINDYKYSQNGQLLAIADSQGFIHIYKKQIGNKIAKICDFKADQASILSLSWADPKYGNILAAGTFSNKVLIFQQQLQGWKQIAHNEVHAASVNCVQWAPCGLKLYAGSSDGKISILQLVHKNWKKSLFLAGQSPIISISLQPLPFGEIIASQNSDMFYSRIAVATKDMKIRVFAHSSQQLYNDASQQDRFIRQEHDRNQSGYSLIKEYLVQKQTVKNMIWRTSWGSLGDNLKSVKLIYCTQEGSVKILVLCAKSEKLSIINQGEAPISRIAQSLTGNLVTASLVHKTKHETIVFQEVDNEEWVLLENSRI